MTTSEIGILISIIVYMVAIIGIGVYYSKVNNSTEDFYLGGRKLGPFRYCNECRSFRHE